MDGFASCVVAEIEKKRGDRSVASVPVFIRLFSEVSFLSEGYFFIGSFFLL